MVRSPRWLAISEQKGACLLGKAGRELFYGEWEGSAARLRRWLRVRCGTLARDLRGEGADFLDADPDGEV